VKGAYLIDSPLDDKTPSAGWYQLLEYFLEIFCNLFERAFDGLILALVEHFDKLSDCISRCIEILAATKKLIPLFGKVAVLLKRLFVHMRKFFQVLVNVVQLSDKLSNWSNVKI
jgi:hypothetical protein